MNQLLKVKFFLYILAISLWFVSFFLFPVLHSYFGDKKMKPGDVKRTYGFFEIWKSKKQ